MSLKLRVFTATLLMVLSTTCLSASAEQGASHGVSDAGYVYELIMESEPPEIMKPLPVKLNLSGPDGMPVSGAKISCSLTMPAMAMPHNAPTIRATETPGQYEGIFLITMGGLWVAEFSTVYTSGQLDTVVISLPYINVGSAEDGVNSKLEELFQEKKKTEK